MLAAIGTRYNREGLDGEKAGMTWPDIKSSHKPSVQTTAVGKSQCSCQLNNSITTWNDTPEKRKDFQDEQEAGKWLHPHHRVAFPAWELE